MCDLKTRELKQVFLPASLQQELVAAIRGAFEVAVEIAVREVSEIVGQTTDGILALVRKENESLKERLEQAEALLDSLEEGRLDSMNLAIDCDDQEEDDRKCVDDSSDGFMDPEVHHEEAADPNPAVEASLGKIDFTTHFTSSQENSPEPIVVKQERHEEQSDSSTSNVDFIKEEQLGLDCAEQSSLLEEWQDIQQSCSRQIEDMSSHLLPPPPDNPLLSSDFPNAPHFPDLTDSNPQMSGGHTPPRRGHHSCRYCGLTFQVPSMLRHHQGQCRRVMQRDEQQPVMDKRTRLQLYPPGCSPFRCAVCSREFNRMENLKSHLRIHTGERPYTCSVCSKCFRHSGALTRHFRIHTGEKPYMCKQCGKSFRNCGGLKIHQRTHQ